MHSSSSSSISFSSLVQYVFFAAIVYVLAGAPLNSIFSDKGSYSEDGSAADTSVEKLRDLVVLEKDLSCKEHAYKGVHVLSREPLVVYIDGFLSEDERGEVVGMRYVQFNFDS
jgi:prolyl 4-hydroxylase